MRSLKHSPSLEGFIRLCRDGVLRSISSKGEVIDYARLSPDQIAHSLMLFPEDVQGQASSVFEGADGYNVPEDQLYQSPPEVNLTGLKRTSSQAENNTDGTKG